MKQLRYIGFFESAEGNQYELTVFCFGFLQAFFLLTADAIRSGRHYQLKTITLNDRGTKEVRTIDDILKVSTLIK